MHPKNFREKIIKGNFSGLTNFMENVRYVHARELAQLLASLPEQKAFDTFQVLPVFHQVKVFPLVNFLLQQKIIQQATPTKAAHILNEINADDRVIFFSRLPQKEIHVTLDLLNNESKKSVTSLLSYPENSIARFTNTDCLTITKNFTIAEAGEQIRNNYKDDKAADIIYVVDAEGKLIGDIPARRLLMTDASKQIEEITDESCVKLHVTYTTTTAMALFKEHNSNMLPVVDEKQKLLGSVHVDHINALEEESFSREMQYFGGVVPLRNLYSQTPLTTLIAKKVSWILILFIAEILAVTCIAFSTGHITKAALPYMFIPVVLATGGNAGTQSAALIANRFSPSRPVAIKGLYFIKKELTAAFICAALVGCVCFAFMALLPQLQVLDGVSHWLQIAFGTSISLAAVMMFGSLVGAAVPLVKNNLKLKYPLVSAPLLSSVVDIVGVIIYFLVINNLIDKSFP